MNKEKKLIVGSRNSRMALAQTNEFIDAFLIENTDFIRENIEIKPVITSGDVNQKDRLDLIGGKGLFVKEIEQMLIDREIDVAVHSMKDMPTIMTKGLKVSAWLKRGDVREVLISNKKHQLLDLTKKSIIGTSSIRRRSQVLNTRTDLCIKLIRGNVDTRIKKFSSGQYDALILGYGGIKRLNLENRVSQIFSTDEILPPACQAAIGLQTLDEDSELINRISKTNDKNSSIIGLAERTVLATLQANCNSPIGVLASINHKKEFNIKVELFSHNGREKYFNEVHGKLEDSNKLAREVGDMTIDEVGHDYIKKLDILKDDFNYSP
jgi:hydroxymethylbilane synthase|tara:strand:+ start:733 stop:1701 length:969 start_codon:yes stop_codon:yes gene_type:complete